MDRVCSIEVKLYNMWLAISSLQLLHILDKKVLYETCWNFFQDTTTASGWIICCERLPFKKLMHNFKELIKIKYG